eukprot:XP_015580694.2 LOW QUALITY PROTEIN: uncharacterized protein LOC107262036 [Ricinus communis]
MGILSNKSLMFLEDLTLPTFQVIVMTGNTGCARCQQRVSRLISKMTGLREYAVDVQKKQITVKGDFRNKRKNEISAEMRKEHSCYQLKLLLGSYLASCFRKHKAT